MRALLFRDPYGSWGTNDPRQYDESVPPVAWRVERASAKALFETARNEARAAKAETERNARLDAERKAKEEAERLAREKAEAERKAREHGGIQLWEGGPYWAGTNIGAEKPEDYGHYF